MTLRSMQSCRMTLSIVAAVASIVVVAVSGATGADDGIRSGDKIVTRVQSEVKVGRQVLATIEKGVELVAGEVRGEWVSVAVSREGSTIRGWIKKASAAKADPASRPEAGNAGTEKKEETTAMVNDALKVIGQNLEINENLTIRSAGDEGEIMAAYRKLKQASDLEPENLPLRYAAICALRLAAQFASALREMAAFSQAHPEFALAQLTLAGWKEEAEGIAPGVFRYPEWTPSMKALPPLYERKVKTCVLFPAREGIYPRAVLFLKDNEAYWTKEMLRDARVEIAVVHESANPQLVAIYARTLLPGKRPDMQEYLSVLSLSKSDASIAAWSYLCGQDFVDFVVIDNQKRIMLNQRVRLSEGTKKTLLDVKNVLLTTKGRELSDREVLSICQEFQNRYSIDDIERKYFPPK